MLGLRGLATGPLYTLLSPSSFPSALPELKMERPTMSAAAVAAAADASNTYAAAPPDASGAALTEAKETPETLHLPSPCSLYDMGEATKS